MKKQLSCLLSIAMFAAAPTFAASISQDDQATISKAVNQMAYALEKHDASVLADRTFDYAINKAGGRDAYIKVIESSFQALDSKHYKMISYVPQIPQESVEAGPYDVCVIKEQLDFTVDAHTYHIDSFVLGIRKKAEKDWKYLDGASISKHSEDLKKILPGLPASFQVPDVSIMIDSGTVKANQ